MARSRVLDIADDCSKDWIEREGPDGKKFRVFDHENFRRSAFNGESFRAVSAYHAAVSP
jgi:hypothetical protein